VKVAKCLGLTLITFNILFSLRLLIYSALYVSCWTDAAVSAGSSLPAVSSADGQAKAFANEINYT
jgi:hypothetical protein